MKSNTTFERLSDDKKEIQSRQQTTDLQTNVNMHKSSPLYENNNTLQDQWEALKSIDEKLNELSKKIDHLNTFFNEKIKEKEKYDVNLLKNTLLELYEDQMKKENKTIFYENHVSRGRKRYVNALNAKNKLTVNKNEASSSTDEQENI